jgi:hypothetical protein
MSETEPRAKKPKAPKRKARKKKPERKKGAKKATAGAADAGPKLKIELEVPSNGRMGKLTLHAVDVETGKVRFTDKADIQTAAEREKAVNRIAAALKVRGKARLAELRKEFEDKCLTFMDKRREQQAREATGSPDGVAVERSELLDEQPATINRPLCLLNGTAFAAAWCQVKVTKEESDGSATFAYKNCLVVVRGDGRAFAESGSLPNARPLDELRMPVCLNATPPPGRGWGGAGVKRYLAGERPEPAEVLCRLVKLVDRFIDFDRSLTTQGEMCELVALYIMATYLLDAFNVVGYVWPNGEPGCGKTTLLQVLAEAGYMGMLILAGSSYPTLRDLADYGATLAFDDAEAVMDVKRTDPDKRTLLLAGNRRGATVSVKELKGDTWVTRHVQTFCPRSFSAIRLPDPVLGSRSIIVPLIRSGDENRTKANVMDPVDWPCDRRRLVDDLWALGLAHLPELPDHDRRAAAKATLAGRALEPWRAVLAVAHWLEHAHGAEGLYGRMEALSVAYQSERGEYEDNDQTRVLFRALLLLTGEEGHDPVKGLAPGIIAARMKEIAQAEDLTEPDKPFTSARKVGWLMKRQRFKKAPRNERSKCWQVSREEVVKAASAYGITPQERPEGSEAGAPGEDDGVTDQDLKTPY